MKVNLIALGNSQAKRAKPIEKENQQLDCFSPLAKSRQAGQPASSTLEASQEKVQPLLAREKKGTNHLILKFKNQDKLPSLAKFRQLTSSVKKLVLDFSFYDLRLLPTGEEMAIMGSLLAELGQLTNLELNFKNCSRLTEQQFILLSKGLKKLKFLTSLTLNFEQCSNLSTATLLHLGQQIKYLTKLSDLSLNINNCKSITNLAVDQFFKNHPPHLQQINLSLEGNTQIDNQGFSTILHHLKNLSNLQYLRLNIKENAKISGENLSILTTTTWPRLANLNIVLSFFPELDMSAFEELEDNTLFNSIKQAIQVKIDYSLEAYERATRAALKK